MPSEFRAEPMTPQAVAFSAEMRPAVLIMAAGAGSRLWPLSVPAKAKQFAALLHNGETLLQATFRRALTLTESALIYVTVAPGMQAWVFAQCPKIPRDNVLVLPTGCDTLPGVAFATALIEARRPGRVVALLAADNFIANVSGFAASCEQMVRAARHAGALVSLGIRPTFPSEAYGYMRLGEATDLASAAHWGLGYIEKPSRAVASELVAAETYLWNSGIFGWRPDTFYAAMGRADSTTMGTLAAMRRAAASNDLGDLATWAQALPNVSLDHGLMEKVVTSPAMTAQTPQHIFVEGHFDWDDVGSYGALMAHLPHDSDGNVVMGDVTLANCHQAFVVNRGPQPLHVTHLTHQVVAVGANQELLIAAVDQVQHLRDRAAWPLHSGVPARGQSPQAAATDAHGNSSDGPVAFLHARGCSVVGAADRDVVLIGVSNLQVVCSATGIAVAVKAPRDRARAAQQAPSAAPSFANSELCVLATPKDVAEAVAKQVVLDLQEALAQVLRPAVVFSAGSTPTEVYRLLTGRYREALPWHRVRLLQMDAYSGLAADDPSHFHRMLDAQLVQPLDLTARWLHGGESDAEMQAYAADITAMGGLDLVLHGIGRNGHLGFNEPGAAFDSASGRVALAQATCADFARAHPGAAKVPSQGVTLGLSVLNGARRVRVMALGQAKRAALLAGVASPPTLQSPLSSLQQHPNVRYFADRAAWLKQW